LLRKGKRVPMAEPLPAVPYFAFLSRVLQRPDIDVGPMDQPLPTIPIPLLEDDKEPLLDLQKIFTTVFDAGNMEYLINYRQEPDVPLSPDMAACADTQLRASGKRP
jgi:hypothetical protein